MRTTVALTTATRDQLLALKRSWRAGSIDEVLSRLLSGPPSGARALYEAHRKAIDAALRRHRIVRLVAFGSRARGDHRPDSDLDLVATLPKGADLVDLGILQDDLSHACGIAVNVLSAGGVRGRLAAEIARDGVVLVG